MIYVLLRNREVVICSYIIMDMFFVECVEKPTDMRRVVKCCNVLKIADTMKEVLE